MISVNRWKWKLFWQILDNEGSWKRYLRIARGLPVAIFLGELIWLGYRYGGDWVGFAQNSGLVPKDDRIKTVWDWLGLLIVPIVLALAAFFFNRQERQNELKIAEDRNQETALQNYLDKISELILEKGLVEAKVILDKRKSNLQPGGQIIEGMLGLSDAQWAVRDMAQIRTITTLRQLNSSRRNIVLGFLRDADLEGILLERASLDLADLRKSHLYGFNLSMANMSQALLSDAILIGANLSGANLIGADLRGANLDGADLRGINLSMANLSWANLSGTNLSWADLSEAIVTKKQLASVKSLAGATLPDGSKAP